MTPQNANTTDTPRARTLVSGRVDGKTYILTLDGGEVVETTDRAIALAARAAKDAGRAFTVDIDRPAGQSARIVELVLLPDATPAPAPTTALVVAPDVPEGLIASPHELRDALAKFRAHYIVLSPAIAISQLAPGYGANLSVVPIDTTVDEQGRGSDTYYNKRIMQPTERALSKIGLVRLAQALGIMWSPDHCRRLDDGRTRNLWRWGYYGVYRTHDGSMTPVSGSSELDLRDGSDEIKAWTANQTQQQRSKGNEICETKAMLRAIRSIGVRQVYSVEELKKPFLIVRFSFTPDMADPAIKALVTEQAMRGASMLFGPAPAALAAPDFSAAGDDPEDPPDPSQTSQTSQPAPAAAAPLPDPFAAPAPAGSTTVVDLKHRSGINPKSKRAWRLTVATFGTGEIASTFDADVQARLETALADKLPVRVTTTASENPAYEDSIATLTVIDPKQPTLPGTEAL